MCRFSGNTVVTGGPAAQVGRAATVTAKRKIFIASGYRFFTNRAME